MKQRRIALLLLMAVSICGVPFFYSGGGPPGERKLIANFYAHQAGYERLRDMLHDDKQLIRLASWGVETSASPIPHLPPEGGFPAARYHEYLALLKQVGGLGISPGPGHGAEILVWASGWASDSRHIYLCWTEQEAGPLVNSLDQYYQTPKPRRSVYRRIESNWYLWADW